MSDRASVTFVLRKIDKDWEGAIFSNGRFLKALVGADLYKLVTKQFVPYLLSDQPEGTEIGINITISGDEPTKEEAKDGVDK